MDVVTVRALVKRYAGRRVIDDFEMHVPQGAIYGFVGKNGAGKSTVMKMIAGLVAPTSGEITLFGGQTSDVRRIGVLLEHPGLLPNLNAYDMMMTQAIAFGVTNPKTACRDLLAQVGLGETGRKPIKGFSLGMKQRLGIALALLGGPDLLLLDEPLNGLDPEAARAMRNSLVELNQTRGITIVISSHVLDQLERMCTHYGVIASGRMTCEMTAGDVERECGQSLRVRTAEPAKSLVLLEDAIGADGVRFAAEPDGSIIVSGAFSADRIAAILHEHGQEVREMSRQAKDMEDYFVSLMEPSAR
ncbi:ABC transporter [Bifidobacterium lemurum]|uniref:ABC transporter n=1 Tax=Bifidobacterium lemurum TaxID=1603886 RepID=A0A261FT08_9BIFI|nr:ATP-binding cassette domain-containing protein [Bifidobacterium lemurum]OZG62287.1 ABC transporter [Bifidobacterium lemurum]QOL33654.1 ATP-binding cassette domain-containing protein [Bifidobacterium lemurum]